MHYLKKTLFALLSSSLILSSCAGVNAESTAVDTRGMNTPGITQSLEKEERSKEHHETKKDKKTHGLKEYHISESSESSEETRESETPVPEEEKEEEDETEGDEVTAVEITASLVAPEHVYIGDTLSASDFHIAVQMSDGSVLEDPLGWAAWPLAVEEENHITVTYQGTETVLDFHANVRPAPAPSPSPAPAPAEAGHADSLYGVPYAGQLVIPELGVNLPVYKVDYENVPLLQMIADAPNAGFFGRYGNSYIIGDHSNQGFGAIYGTRVGTEMEICGTRARCVRCGHGVMTYNLITWDNGSEGMTDQYWYMYTCAPGGGVFIAVYEPF